MGRHLQWRPDLRGFEIRFTRSVGELRTPTSPRSKCRCMRLWGVEGSLPRDTPVPKQRKVAPGLSYPTLHLPGTLPRSSCTFSN